ncbi:response regulator transcription factor [Thauera linaloolentis]|uniref:LuxR family DNA-binding response regulator n=1 Tax=Thauera linaloolentis (strain DSM 12138 / JCM 21573 / CCUG 41526 / CIP 105981 / IAM 15112 / NBRC 102519 / 47Lol) TaxID=1123367 RepID=N6XQI3_THAL4|nr:response regulator [Thauera linaloolentis]ENO83911.1 LuxR family DNA-binding response regulator [Thauera linaloolentis 47Lol = DSM 12138]MCM8566762.1 response regulator [Thauera linaloolentis]
MTAQPPPPPERAVVLLIDDAPDTVRMIAEALDDAGYTVLVATDGATALKRIERVIPDAVLLDACMPGMDGFETCRRLKQAPGMRTVPVIFMTGLAETERLVEGLSAGGIDYLVKPVVPDELVARLQAHLRVAREMNAAMRAHGGGDAPPPPGLLPNPLTQREMDVLEWVARGKTNRDVAEILNMSPRTVNKHLEHIYEKLGVETRTAAVAQFARLARD